LIHLKQWLDLRFLTIFSSFRKFKNQENLENLVAHLIYKKLSFNSILADKVAQMCCQSNLGTCKISRKFLDWKTAGNLVKISNSENYVAQSLTSNTSE
jgi:hypothetical protein